MPESVPLPLSPSPLPRRGPDDGATAPIVHGLPNQQMRVANARRLTPEGLVDARPASKQPEPWPTSLDEHQSPEGARRRLADLGWNAPIAEDGRSDWHRVWQEPVDVERADGVLGTTLAVVHGVEQATDLELNVGEGHT